jgi:3-hydroxyisobutyrate dehydrogenase-like beta-hydroxyacid dehydrogenase
MIKAGVGFIGTGIMGEPMAHRLIQARYPLRVWNRSPEKLNSLVAVGAVPCDHARGVATGVTTVICMLSDGPACDSVLFGSEGVVSAMAPGATVIVMSSIAVETAVDQARRAAVFGVRYLDAPVSGGQVGARNSTLAIMVGGSEEDFTRSAPILATLGRPVRVGPVGSGELAKLVNQIIVASTIATVAEALLIAEKGGASPAKVCEALAGGFADSPILQQHGKRMIENHFVPGGSARWQHKDTRNALAYARTLGLSLPVASVVDSLFADMVEHGDGDLDHSGLIREVRRRNGITVE